MTSFLSDAEKSAISDVFDDIHDTFARDIYIYKKGMTVLVALTDDYNSLYETEEDYVSDTPELTRYTTQARIRYGAGANAEVGTPTDASVALTWPIDVVRLKVNATARSLIYAAEKIELDGYLYDLISEAAPIGPFSINYFTLWFKRGA